jgi:hypothetical protein
VNVTAAIALASDHLWPCTTAGVGPVVTVGNAYLGPSRALVVTAGLVYGGD